MAHLANQAHRPLHHQLHRQLQASNKPFSRLEPASQPPCLCKAWRQDAEPDSLNISFQKASSTAELRAAAYLRAASFYTYPEGRSEWATRSHRRMKADAEWEALSAKVRGQDEAYKLLKVTPWIATIPDDPLLPEQLIAEMDMSSKLPAGEFGDPPARLVVATIDVNRGRALPSEELQGKWPQAGEHSRSHEATDPRAASGDPTSQRAYLSNVCVSKGVRRRGVAKQLIEAAEAAAAQEGVTHMYVHVVADNVAAVQLYRQALGYELESEEAESFARAAGRPRRQLLCKRLR